jgi:hypothetical protein
VPDLLWTVRQDPDTWTKDDRDIAKVWDTEVGNRYRNTSTTDLRETVKEFPDLEPEPIFNIVLYDLDGWHKVCGEAFNETAPDYCTVMESAPPPSSFAAVLATERFTGLNRTLARLKARYVNTDFGEALKDQFYHDPHHEIPTINTIFDGIRIGM